MAHDSICPGCASRYEDIRGLLYSPGATVGTQCLNDWHRGSGFDRSKLVLTAEDRVLLAGMKVKV